MVRCEIHHYIFVYLRTHFQDANHNAYIYHSNNKEQNIFGIISYIKYIKDINEFRYDML
jgi:hypothetical protein